MPPTAMNGQHLWTLFLGGQVPDTELVALGEDAGHLEEKARPPSQQALLKICMKAAKDNGDKIVFTPSQLFIALKFAMPDSKLVRRGLLHSVASEYEQKKPFPAVFPDVRIFFEGVASALGRMIAQAAPAAPAAGAVMAGSPTK